MKVITRKVNIEMKRKKRKKRKEKNMVGKECEKMEDSERI